MFGVFRQDHFDFSGPRKKLPGMAPNGAGSFFFPANPNLADILGRTDLNFVIFYFLDFFGSQIFGLGPAWAHPLGPGVGPTHLVGGPTRGPSQKLGTPKKSTK